MELLKEYVDKAKQITEDTEKYSEIQNDFKKKMTERILSQQISFLASMNEASSDPSSSTAGVANWDPVLVRMVRRSTPQLMAFDLAGIQPMTGPSGSIFAIRSRYADQNGAEALFNEADSGYSGTGVQAGDTSGFAADAFGTGDPAVGTSYGTGMSKADSEALGTVSGTPWREMAFSVERTDVTAVGRNLRASFTRELAHDLRQIHGLDAETELANVLATEIVAEQDRELLRTVNVSAVVGAQYGVTTPGVIDLDADTDGRWLAEKFKGLVFRLEIEANALNVATRRGKANRIICSANVASALNMAGMLDYSPALLSKLNVDINSNTFAGVLMGTYQVHVDPYATVDYITVGYKGESAWDAGIYVCPYVPLEMVRAKAFDSFQPAIGFATRYGMVANPFASTLANGNSKPGKGLGQGENEYFRKFRVSNLTGYSTSP